MFKKRLPISHLWCVILVALILMVFFWPTQVLARVTPQDIVNSKTEAYESTVKNYLSDHKQKLKNLSDKIAQVNKKRTDEMDYIMQTQATILDEYERRQNGQDLENIKNARYWITYAHEAVAYQAAKIYIFNLNGEENIKNDALNLILSFEGELNSSRTKVIYSQKILAEIIK